MACCHLIKWDYWAMVEVCALLSAILIYKGLIMPTTIFLLWEGESSVFVGWLALAGFSLFRLTSGTQSALIWTCSLLGLLLVLHWFTICRLLWMWCGMIVHVLPVLTVCQPIEKRVLACTMYMVTGLWLWGPEPQDSCTVVSVMSVTTSPSGAPGGPGAPGNKNRYLHQPYCTAASQRGEISLGWQNKILPQILSDWLPG